MKLLTAVERLAALDHSAVTYDQGSCLYAHDKFSECEACLGVCPLEAIQPGQPPHFDAEACAGCLACLPLCPTGAYSADDAVHNLLNCTSHVESTRLELVCQAHPKAQNGVSDDTVGIRVRGCLAGLGSGAYLALVALGMEKITVRLDACSECPWGGLQKQVEAQVEDASRLLAAWGKADLVRTVTTLKADRPRPLWEAQNPPLSRRDLFVMLSRQGQTTLARAIEREDAPTSRQVGRGHRRLANAMAHLAQPNKGKDNDLSLVGLGFGTLEVNETCTACGSCARICPTGALIFETDGEGSSYSLNVNPQQCIGCQACLHVCAESSIRLDPAPSFDRVFGSKEPITLRSGELFRCERCQALFAARPGAYLCPLCEFRQQNPFGSRLPAGFSLPKVRRA
jgi:ferredoxin